MRAIHLTGVRIKILWTSVRSSHNSRRHNKINQSDSVFCSNYKNNIFPTYVSIKKRSFLCIYQKEIYICIYSFDP